MQWKAGWELPRELGARKTYPSGSASREFTANYNKVPRHDGIESSAAGNRTRVAEYGGGPLREAGWYS